MFGSVGVYVWWWWWWWRVGWVSGAVEGVVVVVVVVAGAVGRGYWMWRGDRTVYANLSTDRPISVTHQPTHQPT